MKQLFEKWHRKLLEMAVAKLNKLSEQGQTQEKTYVSLSADENIPEIDIKQYLQALTWALKEKHLRNIALTGPFGSGKSSILLSFQRKHPEYKFLSISLASFAPANGLQLDDPKKGNSIQVDSAELEQSILRQIFYSSSPSDIPDTTISRRQGLGKYALWRLTAAVATWALSIIYLTETGFTRQPVSVINFMRDYGNAIDWSAYSIFILGTIILIHKAVVSLRKFVLEKFKFSASSLEVEGQNIKSVLNRNIDELLYFFSVKRYNGLIIEDLDRFRNTDVFSKLRALNILLNNSGKFEKKPLVFIYAIQDNLFNVNDRTKFFDFIIPVVPVVNSSNAGEQLLKLLQTGKHAQDLGAAYVLTIGSFVHDMRMVKNIFNEYVMYKDRIGIDAEFKLLGMIAYKNIYPEDFSALHEGSGMIHTVFANKSNTVIQKSSSIAEEITELGVKVATLEAEIAQNVAELNAIYVLKMLETFSNLNRITIGNRSFLPTELTKEEIFNELRNEKTIYLTDEWNAKTSSKHSFTNIENLVDSKRTYAERLAVVKSREIFDLVAAKRQLTGKIATRDRLQSLSLHELLKSISMSEFSPLVAKQPLLLFLLESGAIDELYQLYISNFYEGALKKNDQLFLIDVKTRTRRNPEYKLVNVDEIVKRLNVDDFTSPETLNFDLTKHLCTYPSRYNLQLGALSEQLKTNIPEVWTFIQACVGHNELIVFEIIPDFWPEFWRDLIIHYKDLDELHITYLSILLMKNTPQKLTQLNDGDMLSNFIKLNFVEIRVGAGSQEFTEKQRVQIATRVEELVDLIEINVNSIDTKLSITSPVYTHSRYAIALNNFETLLAAHTSKNNDQLVHNGLLTRIFESQLDALKDYCQKHIAEVIELLVNKGQIEMESPEIVFQILNNQTLSVEQKQRFVDGVDFRLAEIATLSIESDENDNTQLLTNTLLASRKFEISWENILIFYDRLGLNDQLTNFLNDLNDSGQDVILSFESLPTRQEEVESLSAFSRAFVKSEAISDRLYLRLAPLLSLISKNVLEVTPKNRVRMLIESDLLPFDQDNISVFEADNELLEAFLLHNVNKLGLVKLTAKHFECIASAALTDVQKHLIGNAIISASIHNHASLIATVAEYIESRIIPDPSVKILKDIFESGISEDRKIGIFKTVIKAHSYDELIGFLPFLSYDYDRLNTGATHFERSALDPAILGYLKINGFISDFILTDETIEIHRVATSN